MINQITVLMIFTFLSLNVQAFQTQSFNAKKSPYASLCMTAEGLPGQLPPMGYFDPFALAENKSDLQVKKVD